MANGYRNRAWKIICINLAMLADSIFAVLRGLSELSEPRELSEIHLIVRLSISDSLKKREKNDSFRKRMVTCINVGYRTMLIFHNYDSSLIVTYIICTNELYKNIFDKVCIYI